MPFVCYYYRVIYLRIILTHDSQNILLDSRFKVMKKNNIF